VLSPILFSIYVDDLIGELRNSGYGIYIGRLFVGCILYADDILLLSSSCYGLQSMLNVCDEFGNKWDIVFNVANTRCVTFGGNSRKQFTLAIGAKHLSWCTKLKYLGCIFLDGSCEIDISPPVGKFYAQFNNIMAVLGKYNNKMAVVRLTNSYCVPSMLYACEMWSLSNSSAHSVRVALNKLFRRIFNCCWRENPKSLLFYCGTLPALYTVDQRRILFHKKLKQHNSILIRTTAKLCQHDILSVVAKFMALIGGIILSILSRSPCGRRLLHLLYRFLVLSVYVSLLLSCFVCLSLCKLLRRNQ